MNLVYVSPVKGHLVTRYGTGTYIGATRSIVVHKPAPGEPIPIVPRNESEVAWNESEVVAIPEPEWMAHIKEYTRCLTAKALTKRTEADYKAWCEAQAKASATDAENAAKTENADDKKAKKGNKE